MAASRNTCQHTAAAPISERNNCNGSSHDVLEVTSAYLDCNGMPRALCVFAAQYVQHKYADDELRSKTKDLMNSTVKIVRSLYEN